LKRKKKQAVYEEGVVAGTARQCQMKIGRDIRSFSQEKCAPQGPHIPRNRGNLKLNKKGGRGAK